MSCGYPAARSPLAPAQRTKGIALGAGVAVVLRVVFTVLIASLLNTPFLRIVGAGLLSLLAARPLHGDLRGAEVDGRWRLEVSLREE